MNANISLVLISGDALVEVVMWAFLVLEILQPVFLPCSREQLEVR